MQLASPLAWWLILPAVAAIAAAAFLSYRRPLVPLTAVQRATLISLRVLALLTLLLLLSRPVLLLPPAASGDVVIPVLVDTSRSMSIADAGGQSRAAAAHRVLGEKLLPQLKSQAQIDVLRVAEGVSAGTPEEIIADGARSDLAAAVAAVSERYRGRRVPGIVLLSDGGDTSVAGASLPVAGVPVFAVGVGSPEGPPDREVLSLTAGDPKLDRSTIDLQVAAVSRGRAREPFTLRLLANGQLQDSRRVTPTSDAAPVGETFTVSPDLNRPTIYTAELSGEAADTITENDTRSVLVSPAGRKRRVLVLAGAPGYEHSFLLRALSSDSGLEVDSVVRKGKNDAGVDTFLVQAFSGRVQALVNGFPSTREALFEYDAVVIANLEAEFFSRAQLELARAFVGERGGGLLVLGGRSFERRGLIGTAVEEVLPLELNDRHGGALRESGDEGGVGGRDKVALTAEGERHPIMRFAATSAETRALWASLPPLASNAPVGGPRPGASVLATLAGANGVTPLIAVQRYARGRSMIFAGEASWQWRMMTAASDHRYETFWQQALRWLSAEAPERVTIDGPADAEPGEAVNIVVEARDRGFAVVPGANVAATVTSLSGDVTPLTLRPTAAGASVASFSPREPGAYRVHVTAKQGSDALGDIDRWLYVGGGHREMSEPWLNEAFLQRLTRQTGGAYVRADQVDAVIGRLLESTPAHLAPVRRDLWHEPWMFGIVVTVLAAEWGLRRLWGLR